MNVKIKGFKFVLSKHINESEFISVINRLALNNKHENVFYYNSVCKDKGVFTIYFGLLVNEDHNDSELCCDFKSTFNSLSSLFKDLMLHFEKGIISFSLNN